MSSHIALSTYVPKFTKPSADERAVDRWGLAPLPAKETDRHHRLMTALRRLSNDRPMTVAEAREESDRISLLWAERDPRKWRNAAAARGLEICDA